MWLKTPIGEEQASQAVLDPQLGKFRYVLKFFLLKLILFYLNSFIRRRSK